jgi:hypothetical protein
MIDLAIDFDALVDILTNDVFNDVLSVMTNSPGWWFLPNIKSTSTSPIRLRFSTMAGRFSIETRFGIQDERNLKIKIIENNPYTFHQMIFVSLVIAFSL